jgi:hypothetical protein
MPNAAIVPLSPVHVPYGYNGDPIASVLQQIEQSARGHSLTGSGLEFDAHRMILNGRIRMVLAEIPMGYVLQAPHRTAASGA